MSCPTVRGLATITATIVLAAACSGPSEPLAVGIKGVPTDVLLGAKKAEARAAVTLPPDNLFVGAPGFDTLRVPNAVTAPLPLPPKTTIAPGPPVRCPTVDPLAAPRVVAEQTITDPPVDGQILAYRNVGSYEISGANASSGSSPAESTRTVRNVAYLTPGNNEYWFRYEIVSLLGDLTTTTTYAIVPEMKDPAVLTRIFAGAQPGLYIMSVSTRQGAGPASTFDPEPNLELLPFPIVNGMSFSSAGTDPTTGETLGFRGTIGQKARVDACGTVLDSFSVRIDGLAGDPNPNGVGVNPSDGSRQSFVADYKLAPQFGGLSLDDAVDLTVVAGSVTAHRKNTATISTVPKRCVFAVVKGRPTCPVTP